MIDLKKYISGEVNPSPLITFRIIYGILMMYSISRFWLKGWIYELYILPEFHFKYYGFEFIQVPEETTLYLIFSIMLLSALFITLGLFYRVSALIFFLLFTYVELFDKALYLNHYYFVSLIAFLMVLVPAGKVFSIDNKIFSRKSISNVPAWTINIIKFQIVIVYFYAGIAKLNYDWMFLAQPLKIWLPANSNLPIIGSLLTKEITAYIFSWFGMLYDISIWFFLLYNPTRKYAYFIVIIFHGMTALLFQIGVFPVVMTFVTLIFFSSEFHSKLLNLLGFKSENHTSGYRHIKIRPVLYGFLLLFSTFQLIWPLRFLQYSGNLFWHEQGYRFSWRVMLMEKSGRTFFHVKDSDNSRKVIVEPRDYLSLVQEKQMSTQADMILEFAHFLEKEYIKKGYKDPIVNVESTVLLNGHKSGPLINKDLDLTLLKDGFKEKSWIINK